MGESHDALDKLKDPQLTKTVFICFRTCACSNKGPTVQPFGVGMSATLLSIAPAEMKFDCRLPDQS